MAKRHWSKSQCAVTLPPVHVKNVYIGRLWDVGGGELQVLNKQVVLQISAFFHENGESSSLKQNMIQTTVACFMNIHEFCSDKTWASKDNSSGLILALTDQMKWLMEARSIKSLRYLAYS